MRRKTLPLLAYLLLHRGATLSRDFLAFLLWPDEEEEVARTRFRATLHDLLNFLPPTSREQAWITAEGTGICWNPETAVAVDVDEFDAAIRAEDLEGAVNLYHGDLLEGLYEEWLISPRERLRSAYLSALARASDRPLRHRRGCFAAPHRARRRTAALGNGGRRREHP